MLVTPDDSQDYLWSNTQKNLRSIVERVNAMVKCWRVAGGVFKQAPEYQELALLIVYQVVQMYF